MSFAAIHLSRLNRDSNALIGGLLAYGAAELATRAVRIVAIVVIAHRLSPSVMGAAALALSLFELVRVLANAGIGQRIVAASDAALPAICATAQRLFWVWCGGVALFQLFVAGIVALMGQSQVAAMLAMLSAVYLMMPGGLVQVFLLMRDGRLNTTARIAATQTLADHFLSMALVILWPTAWAIVLPKLLTTPIWLLGVRRAMPWRASASGNRAPARDFLGFGAGVLATELVLAGRQQLDKLIVGGLLGTKALGIYYFAFNAGLGITNSFVGALATVLFPYLCKATDPLLRHERLIRSLKLALALFLPVVLAQILLAPIYVPLLFGEKWADATGLVSILGLGAIPMIFASVMTAWLRASGTPGLDARIGILASMCALGALTLGLPYGLAVGAAAYVLALYLVIIPAALIIFRRPLHLRMAAFCKGLLA